ncbi:ABC-2 type transport system permease protein [Paenibacillus shirakamiensis]|uniref:ABC-2 type transport system permease protein n=1 Tax=Paenibacillus shirakamiensis TaxID=1265935 RepID=A0ABS4JI76_9BACL|nr:ABC transporter permease [Paenibacillus shirakamiensis]MBP2001420.1 ABC-2 type transport system permease protein [Paenibacillus shirakamiensis]
MNILSIALKEIKRDFRDRRTLLFMLAFPIVLMLILGLTLSSAFNSGATVSGIKVLVQEVSNAGPLQQGFDAFQKEVKKNGITFVPLQAGMDAKAEVKNNHYTAFASVDKDGISLYSSNRNPIESNIVQGMLTAFTDKYNAVAAVAQHDPAKVQQITADASGASIVQETSIVANRSPGSIDYYALAMSVMIGFWAALPGAKLISGEIKEGTAVRLMAAPVSKAEIFIGKIVGSVVQSMLCVVVVVLFSKYVFKAYWGDHMGLTLGLLLTEVVLATGLGLTLSYIFKGGATMGLINLIIQLASFLGGAYFPIGDDAGKGIMSTLVSLSPIRWVNHAATSLIYGNQSTLAIQVIGVNLAAAAVLIGVSALIMRRREGL